MLGAAIQTSLFRFLGINAESGGRGVQRQGSLPRQTVRHTALLSTKSAQISTPPRDSPAAAPAALAPLATSHVNQDKPHPILSIHWFSSAVILIIARMIGRRARIRQYKGVAALSYSQGGFKGIVRALISFCFLEGGTTRVYPKRHWSIVRKRRRFGEVLRLPSLLFTVYFILSVIEFAASRERCNVKSRICPISPLTLKKKNTRARFFSLHSSSHIPRVD